MINTIINFNKFCLFSSIEIILRQKNLRPFTLYTYCNYHRLRRDVINELKNDLALFLDINELI